MKQPRCHAGRQDISRCHTRGLIAGIHCMQAMNQASEGIRPALKPRADVTRSPKQGYQWPPPPPEAFVLQYFLKKEFMYDVTDLSWGPPPPSSLLLETDLSWGPPLLSAPPRCLPTLSCSLDWLPAPRVQQPHHRTTPTIRIQQLTNGNPGREHTQSTKNNPNGQLPLKYTRCNWQNPHWGASPKKQIARLVERLT